MTHSPDLQALINAIEQADTPERLMGAVRALSARQLEAAIPTLIQVLGYNNPGAAMMAVQGLVQMGERAVLPLLTLLDDYNYGARAYAIRALSTIADPRALDVLLETAETDFAPSVRRAATKGIGLLHWGQLAADQVAIAQERTLHTLQRILQDPDWSLRYAAVVGLQGLAIASPSLCPQILLQFHQLAEQEPDRAVRARVLWAIAQLTDTAPVTPSDEASSTPPVCLSH